MTWLQPLAWFGLTAMAIPVLVHLLTRRPVARRIWPTLRFIEPMSIQPTRNWRVSDPWLLALRGLIVAAAVSALAGPRFLTSERAGSVPRVAAILVDTSASMSEPDASGATHLADARGEAARIAQDFNRSAVAETPEPGRAILGAAAWLAGHGGRMEIVVISDFQRGTVDPADLSRLPAGLGLRFIRVGSRVRAVGPRQDLHRGGQPVDVRTTLGETDATAEWRRRPAAGGVATSAAETTIVTVGGVQLLADASDRDRLGALAKAVTQTIPVSSGIDSTRPTAVVFPSFPERDAWMTAAALPDQPWMFTTLQSAPRHDGQGRQPVTARARMLERGSTLVLFTSHSPDSLGAASLVAALARSNVAAIQTTEYDPAAIDSAALAGWERPATTAPDVRSDSAGPSDGRWFWALVLLLLTAEWLVRRQVRAAPEVLNDARAA